MVKTEIFSATLTGGTTYDTITQATIPLFSQLQVEAPSGGLKYRVNGTPAGSYKEIAEGDLLNHPLSPATAHDPCKDIIAVCGSGTIKVEIQYYEN